MTIAVKAVVFNHNRRNTAEALFHNLKDVFDTALFDSGSDADQISLHTTHAFPNLYWTGCWNKAFEEFPEADVIWGIGGDCTLTAAAPEYLRSIETLYPFGLWSPVFSGRAHSYMQYEGKGKHAYTVQIMEGIAFAISRELREKFGSFDSENYLGHGQDLYVSHVSRQHNLKNIIDTSVTLSHPPSDDYDNLVARSLMFNSMSKLLGEDWQDIIDWWWGRSVSFEANAISRITLKDGQKHFIRPFLKK